VSELVAAYQAGSTVTDLARKFSVQRETVYDTLKRQGVPLRKIGLSPEEVTEAAALYSEGWPLARIGEKLDVAGNTVGNALRKADVVLRRPGGRKRAVAER
jgi:hypothetical protein